MLSHSEKTRLARTVQVMRQSGGAAVIIAQSKLDGVIDALAYAMSDDFSPSEVETRIREIIFDSPSVKLESEAHTRATKEAIRANTPDPKALNAADRLALANRAKLVEMEATAANGAKLKSDRDLSKLNPVQRLELANKRKGEDKPEPKALTPEQLKALPAGLRLSRANAEAMRKAEANAKRNPAAEHMSAAQRLQIADEAKRLGLKE